MVISLISQKNFLFFNLKSFSIESKQRFLEKHILSDNKYDETFKMCQIPFIIIRYGISLAYLLPLARHAVKLTSQHQVTVALIKEYWKSD